MFPHFKENKNRAIEYLAGLLNEEGCLCIAHSQSREQINALHQRKGEAVKEDNLPKMKVLKEVFEENGLSITTTIDTDEMFVIVGKRIKKEASALNN